MPCLFFCPVTPSTPSTSCLGRRTSFSCKIVFLRSKLLFYPRKLRFYTSKLRIFKITVLSMLQNYVFMLQNHDFSKLRFFKLLRFLKNKLSIRNLKLRFYNLSIRNLKLRFYKLPKFVT